MKKLIIGYDYNYHIDEEWYFYTKFWKKTPWSYASWWYMQITMRLNWKYVKRYVHRLVWEYFIANIDNKQEINHLDYNKKNNNYLNLEWNTRSENELHKRKSINDINKILNAINDVWNKEYRWRKYWVSSVTIWRREKKYK